MLSDEAILWCIIASFGSWIICLICLSACLCKGEDYDYTPTSTADDDGGDGDQASNQALLEDWSRFLLALDEQNQSNIKMRVVNALPYNDNILTKCSLVLKKKHMIPSHECFGESKNEDMDETDQFVDVEERHVDVEDRNSHVMNEPELKNDSLCKTDHIIDVEEGNSQALDESEGVEGSDPDQSQYTHILIPCNRKDTDAKSDREKMIEGDSTRKVPIFCAICHSEYKISEKVTWSSNPECPHVFHQKCITQWVISSLRTQARKRTSMIKIDCPMCRQDFFKIGDEESFKESVDSNATHTPVWQSMNE